MHPIVNHNYILLQKNNIKNSNKITYNHGKNNGQYQF